MTLSLQNPFSNYGCKAYGSDFIGRDNEIDKINNRIFNHPKPGSIVIIGLPSFGKKPCISLC